jgi:hypothetical protein
MTRGEIVPIVYDPANPKSSCLGDPNKQLKSAAIGVIFMASAPTMTLFVLFVRKGFQSSAAT